MSFMWLMKHAELLILSKREGGFIFLKIVSFLFSLLSIVLRRGVSVLMHGIMASVKIVVGVRHVA